MNIIHIFTNMNYVYTEALIKMFSNRITDVNHTFFICDKEENVPNSIIKLCGNRMNDILFSKTNDKKIQAKEIISLIEKSDYVIFHFLPNNIYLHLKLKYKKFLLKKIVWRIWGADLYNWKKSGLKGILFNKVRENTRKGIKYVIAEPMDRPEYINQFGKNTIFLEGPDPKGYDVKNLENTKVINDKNIVKILLGHSAVKTLNHCEVLNKLKEYKDKNIEIIIPLNYGNMRYAKKVSMYAFSLFPKEKIYILNKKLCIEEYMSLLWNCDIGIFHTDRQIAMGNITMMMYMGKKIYLKSDSIMDNYYRKKENLNIFDSDKIGNMSFESFIHNNNSDINRAFAIREIDISVIAKVWQKTFTRLENYL